MNFIKLSSPLRKKRIILESPYGGSNLQDNISYARRCLHHSIRQGEAPIASHLLYTQPNVLDDLDPLDRALGIECGLAWLPLCDLHVFYTDKGWSPGMISAYYKSINHFPIELRSLFGIPEKPPGLDSEVSKAESAIDTSLAELKAALDRLQDSLKEDLNDKTQS